MPKQPLLTTQDVADRLGVSVFQVHRLVKRGDLTCTQQLPGLRGARLFTEADLARYLRVSA